MNTLTTSITSTLASFAMYPKMEKTTNPQKIDVVAESNLLKNFILRDISALMVLTISNGYKNRVTMTISVDFIIGAESYNASTSRAWDKGKIYI